MQLEDQENGNCCSHPKKSLGFFAKYSLLPCFGLALYLLDMMTDVNAAYWDYRAGDFVFACITIGLVFAPGLLFAMYASVQYLIVYMGEIACLKAPFLIIISPLLPLWVIFRDITRIFEGFLATVCPGKRESLVAEREKPSKIYLLKFLEAFTEAAPQLLVRLYRVALRHPHQFSDLRTSEIIQICFSVFILSLKVVSTHQKSVSTQQVLEGEAELHSKYRLPWFIQILALVWWVCFLLTRFEALALFSASYGYWVLLIIGIHVLLMFLFQTIAFQKDQIRKIFVYLFGGFVFIFAYVQFNLETRIKIAAWLPYVLFSVVIFVENSIMLTFWVFDQRSNVLINIVSNNVSYLTTPDLFGNGSTLKPDLLGTDVDSNFSSGQDLLSLITETTMKSHWRTLLFVHYGVFALGVFSMILTFWAKSFVNSNERNKLSTVEPVEMETLNSPS